MSAGVAARPTLGLLAHSGLYGLATDLYEITMAAAYLDAGLDVTVATFEMFVRDLPERRGYLVVAGLEQVVEYLRGLSFDGASIDHLRALPSMADVKPPVWERLRALRFTGDLWAIPEGTVAFANEPLLRVRAPIVEAQLVETFVLSTVNHQTAIATKAARVVEAAAGRGVIEFGARRAHGFDAAVFGARAAVIGGCIGTSNVLAGRAFGLDVYGTAAHSFTMAFTHETDAFAAFHRTFPRSSILLVDTYDTLEGVRRAVSVGPIRGVRLDSGDMLPLSREARRILDGAGQPRAIIVASGDLDEERVADLVAAGAPIDLFGVGTELITSRDAPALGGVYKLVAIDRGGEHRPVRKLSAGKATYPDAKQVLRAVDGDGRFAYDTLALADERVADGGASDVLDGRGEPLLVPVLRGGELVGELPALPAIRAHARAQRESLPLSVRRLRDPERYPVRISARLERLMTTMHPET
ncbi:MAG: nicotinate phosphoribosyltransferase [Deltaproteobacteria bacterium]|nr:nicotinate phosphoribosyltransferase [Deltaproteobacteria bacterium]